MTARRVVALVVAIALVGGAAFVRYRVIDDGDRGPGGTSAPTRGPIELVCSTELEAVCRTIHDEQPSLSVRVEDAGDTLDALATLADPEDAPLWLTVDPFPAMVDLRRTSRRIDPIDYAATPVGATPLGVAFPADGRAAVVDDSCAEPSLWTCFVHDVGASWAELGGDSSWGTFRPAFGDVAASATALASYAFASSGFLDTTSFGTAQLENRTYIAWIRPMAQAAGRTALSGGTPLLTMVTRPSALDAGATTAQEVTSIGSSADRFEVIYPDPDMWMQAVLAIPHGTELPDALSTRVDELVVATGWGPAADGVNPVPDATTMLALRAFWAEAT